MPEVGDQIQVAGTKVDQVTRSGVVTDVLGRMITVQWATGDQSVFVPAPGTLTVLGRAGHETPQNERQRESVEKFPGNHPGSAVDDEEESRGRRPSASQQRNVARRKPRKAPVRKPARNVAREAAEGARPQASKET